MWLHVLFVGVVAVLVAHYVRARGALPILDHDAFRLPERQLQAARALADHGARFCCEGECDAHRRALGEHGRLVLCASPRALALCHGGEGVVAFGEFHAGAHSLESLEALLRHA